jgi:hypothetical protein
MLEDQASDSSRILKTARTGDPLSLVLAVILLSEQKVDFFRLSRQVPMKTRKRQTMGMSNLRIDIGWLSGLFHVEQLHIPPGYFEIGRCDDATQPSRCCTKVRVQANVSTR